MRTWLLLTGLLCGCSTVLDFDDQCAKDTDCPTGQACNADGLCILFDRADARMQVTDGGVSDVAVRPDGPAVLPRDAGPDGPAPDMAAPPFALDPQCPTVHGISVEQVGNPEIVILGVLLPFSGQLGAFGQPIAQAVYLAVDQINQNGGLDGRRVGVVTCDTGTEVALATAAARRLVDQVGVPAIIGPAASSITLEVFNEVAKPAGVLVITPSGTSAALTDQADNDLLWRTVPSDAIQGAAIAAHVLAEGFERVAVINRDDTYGQGLRSVIQGGLCAAERCDETHYFSRAYPEDGAAAAQAELLFPLRMFDPEVVVLVAFLDDGVQFMNLAAAAGYENFILTDGVKDAQAIEDAQSERLLRDAVGTAPASPAGATFQAFGLDYQNEFGTEAGVFNANAYDAAWLLAYGAAGAIAAGETVSGATLALQLRRLSTGEVIAPGPGDLGRALAILRDGGSFNYEGASGQLDFDDAGEAPSDIEGWYFNLDRGRIESHGIIYTADGDYLGIPDPPEPDAGPPPEPDAGGG